MDHPVRRFLRFGLFGIVFSLALIAILDHPISVRSQDSPTAIPGAFAEAIKQANVRSGPGITYPQVGTIESGTKYPIIGRSALYPWYLIALPDQPGWVFADLVKVTGSLNSVPISETILTPGASLPPPSATATTASNPAAPGASSPSLSAPQPSETPLGNTGVTAEAISTANVRYGPGTDFPRVGTINKGERYVVLRRHALYPWLEIEYDSILSHRAWVSKQTVTITGDLNTLPATDAHSFDYPTLTPTPIMVITSAPPWSAPASNTTNNLSALGNTIYDLMLKAHFEPGTERQGSVFILDLRTGQNVSLNPHVAYSGVSMMKIAVLLALYRKTDQQFNAAQSKTMGEMMVCSENSASNAVLRFIGSEDEVQGAMYVTDTLRLLGLRDTFLSRPFYVGQGADAATPDVERALKTSADQSSAEPDLYNQATPADLGWLLSAVYRCALDGSGPIATAFNGDVSMMECRHIVAAMRADKIGTLVEAGVPLGMSVAHKHGWSNDTHGDAALLTTPGGDYILVAMLHNQEWLKSDDSFPLVAEMSRLTYNTFNPTSPLDKIHLQTVPANCSVGDDLIVSFQARDLPPIR